MTKNPFTQPEDLKPWLEQSPKYLSSREKSLHQFLKYRQSKQIFYSPISIFMNTFHKYTLSTLVAGVILSSTVGAFAAETLAPEQYKPSSVFNFSANKQADKNPYTALAPDENNFVGNLTDANLALKFPKQINGQKISFSKSQVPKFQEYNISTEDGMFAINITASRENFGSTEAAQNSQKLTREELREKTGWLVTEAEISDITLSDVKYKKSTTLKEVTFRYKDIFYRVIEGNEMAKNKIELNQIQLQFNSLVTSNFSPELNTDYTQGGLRTTKLEELSLNYNNKLTKSESTGNNPMASSTINLTNYELNSEGSRNTDSNPNNASVNVIANSINSNEIKKNKQEVISDLEQEVKRLENDLGGKSLVEIVKQQLERVKSTPEEDFAYNKIDTNTISYLSPELKAEIKEGTVYLRKESAKENVLITTTNEMVDGKEISKEIKGNIPANETLIFQTKSGKNYSITITNSKVVNSDFNLMISIAK